LEFASELSMRPWNLAQYGKDISLSKTPWSLIQSCQ
jgi:hypothetical protein